MSALDTRRCLHCWQTHAEIERDKTICGIEGGYEYVELIDEWPRHRWTDWTDKNLASFGILPDAFVKYRRTQITAMPYAACLDTERGHVYPDADNDWGDHPDQCMGCGFIQAPAAVAHPPLSTTAAESDTGTHTERKSAAERQGEPQ